MEPAASPSAYSRPGGLERVSLAWDGGEANGMSGGPSLSWDGRFVAFDSFATNLVPGDTNGVQDIFVYDRVTGRTDRASVASDGSQSEWASSIARIGPSGRLVQFLSPDPGLAPGDLQAFTAPQVFLRDLDAGTTERVSVSTDGRTANNLSSPGAMTLDGRFVAFTSWASNLVPGDTNNKADVFVRDRVAGTTERVSLRADGMERLGDSSDPSISADGRFVAYTALVSSVDDDLDQLDEMQVFWHDRETGEVRLVSVASDGTPGNGFSSWPQVSADGRFVAFASQAQNLVPADTNRVQDVFVHDTATGRTERVSVTSTGAESDGRSSLGHISPDGRFVAFLSQATNLAAGDTNERSDVFLHDRETGTTERISVGWDGRESTSNSGNPFVSRDGRLVAFTAHGDEFLPGISNDERDIFVRDRGPVAGVGGLSAVSSGTMAEVSGWATFSGAVVAEADDPPEDGGSGAQEAGAELVGAALVYRPEAADLFVRIRVASLPGVRPPRASGLALGCALAVTPAPALPHLGACGVGLASAPAVTYGLRLRIDQTPFEVRIERGAYPAAGPVAVLYRCDGACEPVASLDAAVGTTGDEVVASVPLTVLGAREGDAVTGIEAYAGPGHPETGVPGAMDWVTLPDGAIPRAEVALGLAPAGASADDVTFSETAALERGAFQGSLSLEAQPDGAHVWARSCLGSECGTASVALPSG